MLDRIDVGRSGNGGRFEPGLSRDHRPVCPELSFYSQSNVVLELLQASREYAAANTYEV